MNVAFGCIALLGLLLIALGLAVSGLLALHESAAARHMALEVEHTPRNAETGIVRGAEAVGMHAIWFRSREQTVAELSALLGNGSP